MKDNWTTKPLGEILSYIESCGRPEGGAIKYDTGFLSLGGEHIHYENGTVDLTNPKWIPQDYYERYKTKQLLSDDILLCKDGALTGKVCIVKNEFVNQPALVNEHIFVLRANEQIILQKFLFLFLYSHIGQELLKSFITGSAQGGISKTNIKLIPVSFPVDLTEQNKIVKRIESIREQTGLLISNIKTELDKLELLRKNYLKSVFE